MSERMYHINLCKEELEGAKAVILPGDPGRVPKIAALLQEAKPLAQNREYTSWLGRLEGQPVAVVSTGIGGPSAAIAVEELSRVDGGTGVILSAHVSLGSWPMFAYGTEEQMQKYLDEGKVDAAEIPIDPYVIDASNVADEM